MLTFAVAYLTYSLIVGIGVGIVLNKLFPVKFVETVTKS